MTKVDQFANDFEAAVRSAFAKFYGPPADKRTLESIRTSWSKEEIVLDWHKPDPRVVVVGTESAWVSDPYRTTRDNQNWEKVARSLTAAGWGEVWFESINPAVHIVFIDVPAGWYPKIR